MFAAESRYTLFSRSPCYSTIGAPDMSTEQGLVSGERMGGEPGMTPSASQVARQGVTVHWSVKLPREREVGQPGNPGS